MEAHLVENNGDSQRHLDENRNKFESDGDFLYRMMKMGKRFSDQEVAAKYGINGRRLRELVHEKPDVEKEWMYNDNGKRTHVEYFVPRVPAPSKTKVIQAAQKVIDTMKGTAKQLTCL